MKNNFIDNKEKNNTIFVVNNSENIDNFESNNIENYIKKNTH